MDDVQLPTPSEPTPVVELCDPATCFRYLCVSTEGTLHVPSASGHESLAVPYLLISAEKLLIPVPSQHAISHPVRTTELTFEVTGRTRRFSRWVVRITGPFASTTSTGTYTATEMASDRASITRRALDGPAGEPAFADPTFADPPAFADPALGGWASGDSTSDDPAADDPADGLDGPPGHAVGLLTLPIRRLRGYRTRATAPATWNPAVSRAGSGTASAPPT